jgi:hypothetical protein
MMISTRNRWFPPFHAADGVFRAVENRVTIGLGTTNGVSLIVDPYGRIMAQSPVNERAVITGQTFVVAQRPLYTVWGDWFGWLMAGFSESTGRLKKCCNWHTRITVQSACIRRFSIRRFRRTGTTFSQTC